VVRGGSWRLPKGGTKFPPKVRSNCGATKLRFSVITSWRFTHVHFGTTRNRGLPTLPELIHETATGKTDQSTMKHNPSASERREEYAESRVQRTSELAINGGWKSASSFYHSRPVVESERDLYEAELKSVYADFPLVRDLLVNERSRYVNLCYNVRFVVLLPVANVGF
jgi:hypothetical protein